MGIKWQHFGPSPRNDRGYVADRNLYLDAAGNLVEEDNPAQVMQLVGKGGAIDSAVAEKHGLIKKAKESAKPADVAADEGGKVAQTTNKKGVK